jgi:glutathione peroxidase
MALLVCVGSLAVHAYASTAYDFTVKDALSHDISLKQFESKKALLIVNTASQCGFTTQYAGLEKLHQTYESKGLQILGFPTNDFNQEPGSDSEIQKFVKDQYQVNFPVMHKLHVNGEGAHPLFKFLKENAHGAVPKASWNPGTKEKDIQWNFSKFLVVNGMVVKRYSFDVEPSAIETDIAKFLQLTGSGGGGSGGGGGGAGITVVNCETTKGPLKIVVNSAWSPIGAKRFLDMVDDGFFNDHPLYRAVDNFLIQFGISGKPAQQTQWMAKGTLKDDENQRIKFKYGFMSYAGGGPNTRDTSVFFGTSTNQVGTILHAIAQSIINPGPLCTNDTYSCLPLLIPHLPGPVRLVGARAMGDPFRPSHRRGGCAE